MQRLVLLFLCPVAIAAGAWLVPVGVLAEGRSDYRPPVDGPIVDPFRPPLERWGPGNRGIDYDAAPGTPVVASAPGEVVFAGPVGGELHVVVLHGDGLRTSYSFLASVIVRRGQVVAAGAPIGTAAGPVHFGVRDGERYVDPAAVLEGTVGAQLLPHARVGAAPEAIERSHLARLLGQLPRRLVATGESSLDGVVPEAWRGWLHYGTEAVTPVSLRAAAALADWAAQRRRCTPVDVDAPVRTLRRIAVLVAGLGSTSSSAAVHDVDTHALGYASDDVVVFSYRGGTTAEHAYEASDTTADLRVTGSRLGALVAALAARYPSVPVDVVAHSQGGVLARIAVLDGAPAQVTATLGSPHQGADLATGAAMLSAAVPGGVAVAPTSVLQMAETSALTRELGERSLPPGARFVSVAARGDLVVPPLRSRMMGADNVIVTLPAPYATVHRRLPSSAAATREIALALAGLPPTCQALADVVADHLVSTSTSLAQDSLGATLSLVGRAHPALGHKTASPRTAL